jgi:predicted nucleic acid-binding protein
VRQANKFILDIQSGKYTGITSTFTLAEYRGVIKRRISETFNAPVSIYQEESAIITLNHFIRTCGIGLVDADLIATGSTGNLRVFADTENTIKTSAPIASGNQWKMIKSVDSLAVTIAIRIGADLFATFDEGFRGLGSSNITPFIVSDKYP